MTDSFFVYLILELFADISYSETSLPFNQYTVAGKCYIYLVVVPIK